MIETPIENEKLNESEKTEKDDEEKAKTIEKVENVEDKKNKKVENEKVENGKVEKGDEESKKSEMKNSGGDDDVHGEADEIINKIKEWYQEGKKKFFKYFLNNYTKYDNY